MRDQLVSLTILSLLAGCSSPTPEVRNQPVSVQCGGATTDYSTLVQCTHNGGSVATCSDYTPTTNGCGPQASWAGYAAAQVAQGPFPFTTCCDAHDREYGTCHDGDDLAVGKTQADNDLYSCMMDRCNNSYPGSSALGAKIWTACCKKAAQIIYAAVDVTQGAQTAYENGQSHACTCQMPHDMASPVQDLASAANDLSMPANDLSASMPSSSPSPSPMPLVLRHAPVSLPEDTTDDAGTSSCPSDNPFTCQTAIDWWNNNPPQ